MRFWNLTWAIPATMGIAVIWAFSAIANYDFGLTQGTNEARDLYFFTITSAQASGMASLAVDLLKAVLPAMIVVAWVFRQWSSVVGGVFCFLLCLGFSAQNSIGFALTSHVRALDERGQTADQWAALRKTLETTQKTRDMVPVHRPAAVVNAEIEAKKADARFAEAESCSKDTRGAINFCREYRGLAAEKAAADSAVALDAKLEDLRTQLDTRKAVSEADPMGGSAAALLGWKKEGVAGGRSLWLAVLVETLSAVGLALVWGVFFVAWRSKPTEARTAAKASPHPVTGTIVVLPSPVPALAVDEPVATMTQDDEPHDPPPPSGSKADTLSDRRDVKRVDADPASPAKRATVAQLATVNGQKITSAKVARRNAKPTPVDDLERDRQTVAGWLESCTSRADESHQPTSGECLASLRAYCKQHRRTPIDQQRMTAIMTEILKPEKVGKRYPRNAKERIWPRLDVRMPEAEPMRASA